MDLLTFSLPDYSIFPKSLLNPVSTGMYLFYSSLSNPQPGALQMLKCPNDDEREIVKPTQVPFHMLCRGKADFPSQGGQPRIRQALSEGFGHFGNQIFLWRFGFEVRGNGARPCRAGVR